MNQKTTQSNINWRKLYCTSATYTIQLIKSSSFHCHLENVNVRAKWNENCWPVECWFDAQGIYFIFIHRNNNFMPIKTWCWFITRVLALMTNLSVRLILNWNSSFISIVRGMRIFMMHLDMNELLPDALRLGISWSRCKAMQKYDKRWLDGV